MSIEIQNMPPQNRPSSEINREKQQQAKQAEIAKENLPRPDMEEIKRQLHTLNKISLPFNRELNYSYNEELDTVIIKVIDKESDKVVKEIPPEELQNLSLRIRETMGLLFDITV